MKAQLEFSFERFLDTSAQSRFLNNKELRITDFGTRWMIGLDGW